MKLLRPAGVVVGAIATLALAAGPASAHFCYNAHAIEQGMAGMASSGGFATFHDLAFEFTGLCDAGIEVLADAAGIDSSTPINVRAVMGGGSGGKTKGIDHLDFEAIDAAFPDAIEACAP